MSAPLPRILVVDVERHHLDTVCRGLRLHGYRCQKATSPGAALDALAGDDRGRIDLVITDLAMAGPSGIDLVRRIRKGWPHLPIVAIAGLADVPGAEVASEERLSVLRKPFDPDTLDATIRRALDRGP